MVVADIIEQVRWCFDEEATNVSLLDYDGVTSDTGLMDNIIKSKIGTALRWVCQTAPTELLNGDGGYVVDEVMTYTSPEGYSGYTIIGDEDGTGIIQLKLPAEFLRLVRVRTNHWHKAVMIPFEEDSEESLMMHDATAVGTDDRPMAIIRRGSECSLELWPCHVNDVVSISYVKKPDTKGKTDEALAAMIPAQLEASFVYYIAYLTLSAYGDNRAERMLDIAFTNMGMKR